MLQSYAGMQMRLTVLGTLQDAHDRDILTNGAILPEGNIACSA
jgi:hypothetical protein